MSVGLRTESYTTYTTRGSRLDSRLVDPDSSDDEIDVNPETVKQVAQACLWGPVKSTSGKVIRVAIWTGLGAGALAPFGGAPAGAGAIGGAIIGVISLMDC